MKFIGCKCARDSLVRHYVYNVLIFLNANFKANCDSLKVSKNMNETSSNDFKTHTVD